MTCPTCHKEMTTQEEACYRNQCEACWVEMVVKMHGSDNNSDRAVERRQLALEVLGE